MVADAVPPLGHGEGRARLRGVAKRVMRPDIYMEAMKEMGVSPKVEPITKWTFWDGVAFDAANPEKYALSFPYQQSRVRWGEQLMSLMTRIGT